MIYYDQNNIVVRRSVKSDIAALKDNLKESDVHEIWASHHHTPEEALKGCVEKAIISMTIIVDGKIVAIFGIDTDKILGKTASVWMLSTGEIEKIKRRIVRHSRAFINHFLEFYPYLDNYVHSLNKESIAWLKFCGATIEEAKPFGIEQEPFHHFYFRRKI